MDDRVSPELRIVTQSRKHCAYIGIQRHRIDKRTGEAHLRYTHNFTRHKGSQHASDAIRDAAAGAIVWTVEDQAKAVNDHGVFLARLEGFGCVCVESMTHGREADLFDALWAKLVAAPNDAFLRRLFLFIKQQDQFGWSDTWETPAIEQRSSKMRWLQDLTEAKRGRTRVTDRQRSEQIRFHLMADKARDERVGLGLPLRKQRRVYIEGCTCLYCLDRSQSTSGT